MRAPSHWGAVGIWNVTTIRPFCFEETTACQTKVSFVISYSEFCRQVRLLPAHNHPLFLWELDKIKHLQNQSCHPLIYKDTLTWLRLDDCNSFWDHFLSCTWLRFTRKLLNCLFLHFVRCFPSPHNLGTTRQRDALAHSTIISVNFQGQHNRDFMFTSHCSHDETSRASAKNNITI